MENNKSVDLNKFGLNLDQIILLYNLECFKTENDIKLTKNESKKALKEKWLEEWKKYISIGFSSFTNQNSVSMEWHVDSVFFNKIINNNPNGVWLRLILLEAMLFTPYYALTTEKDKKGNEVPSKKYDSIKIVSSDSGDDYLNFLFKDKSYYNDGYVYRLRKCYKKVMNELNEVIKSGLIAFGVFAAVLVPVILLAGAFAPAIAVALVGSNFAGLSGAALTSACLAYLGGGAIAIGGAGMAGGTLAIVGGGAALGIGLGAGAGAVAGAQSLLGKKATILQSAKLLVAVREIFLNDEHDVVYSNSIYEQYVQNLINLEKNLVELKNKADTASSDEKKALKKEIKETQETIDAMKIAKKSLAKFKSSFEEGLYK